MGVGYKGLGWFSGRMSAGEADRQHSNHSSVPFTFYLFEIYGLTDWEKEARKWANRFQAWNLIL